MRGAWGDIDNGDIAQVVRDRAGGKYGAVGCLHVTKIANIMEVAGNDVTGWEVTEVFSAKCRYKRWRKVERNYIPRGREGKESDEEENTV